MPNGLLARMTPGRRGTFTGLWRACWSGLTPYPWRGAPKHAATRDSPSRWTRWKKAACIVSPLRTRCPRTDCCAATSVPASAFLSSHGGPTTVRTNGTRFVPPRVLPHQLPPCSSAKETVSGRCVCCHRTAAIRSRRKGERIRWPRISARRLPRSPGRPNRCAEADFAACSIPPPSRAVRSSI